MISEIVTLFSNEPGLLIPAFSPFFMGGVFLTFLFQKRIKQSLAKIAGECMKEKPTWGDNGVDIEEALELCSQAKALKNLKQDAKKLEIKITELEKRAKIVATKIESPAPKGIVIKIGKFRNRKENGNIKDLSPGHSKNYGQNVNP